MGLIARYKADPEVQKSRIATCEDCEHRKFTGHRLLCTKCGCAMSIKSQLRLAKCPIGKW